MTQHGEQGVRGTQGTAATQRAVEAVWRIESARIIGAVARMVRDLGVAEELAQDAFLLALERWPRQSALPDNPGAWLMTVARNRALDWLRQQKRELARDEAFGHELGASEAMVAPGPEAQTDAASSEGNADDDVLRLVFATCHPILSPDARVALTLRLVGGLTTDEIARAYLVPEPTVAQRIVRAKRTLAKAGVSFEVPQADAWPTRLGSVLEVIYLIFNEGYAATAGDNWMRPELCHDALRLGRIVAELAQQEPEVHGLVALMEIQTSRTRARTGSNGEPVLLLEQNRALWDRILIDRGLAALKRAARLGGELGPYRLQAEIAACHARATTAARTDWLRIAELYGTLMQAAPSPVVALNRAVAVSMAYGPAAGLALVDVLLDEPRLARYHLLPSVRGDLLVKLGRHAEARAAFTQAAALTRNARERDLLLARAAASAQAEA